MSVIVKGMEMPYGCTDCDFCGGIIMPDGIYCCDCPTEASHGKNISDAIDNDALADFCPLVEIPTPHGDLVDRNELLAEYDRQHEGEAGKARKIMEQAKTVIEAEGSEE